MLNLVGRHAVGFRPTIPFSLIRSSIMHIVDRIRKIVVAYT